ncbi:unnamed protein product [Urochloa humidicola]
MLLRLQKFGTTYGSQVCFISCPTINDRMPSSQVYLHPMIREKAPQNVQEEDMRKLTALLEQLEVISEAEKKLDAKVGNN